MSESNSGGLSDRNRDPGNVGAGGVESGGGGGTKSTNFNKGKNTGGGAAKGWGYGITPFNVPRKDQTLQDRQFGNLGGGMVSTNFGGGNNAGGSVRAPVTSTPLPPLKKPPIPGVKPQPVRPVTTTPPTQVVPEEPIDAPLDPLMGAPPPSGIGITPGFGVPDPYGQALRDYTNSLPDAGAGGADFDPSQIGVSGHGKSNYGNRQFGGPVGPGQYTVGENGPETLRLGGGSRGQVIPNNPVDRRAGLVAALQGGRPGGGGGITGMGSGLGAPRPMPQVSPGPAPAPGGQPQTPPRPRAMGGWQG